MKKLLTSTWMIVLIGVVLYIGATIFFWKTPKVAPVSAGASQPFANLRGPSWNFVSPEADQLISELKDKKAELDTRESQLNELAARLEAQRAELNQATQAVFQTQMDFDKMVLRVKDDETANLKKLAKVYSAMTPDGAANIFSQMDDETVVKILLFMKEEQVAAVLESLAKKGTAESKRAVDISERVRVSVVRTTASK
jgi:flagellar motility protein MotE (MotC chaperone)